MQWTTTVALVGLVLDVLASQIPVKAAHVVTGVNVVGIQQMSDERQDALIEELQKDGITCVRTGIGDRFNRFIIRAAAHGISSLVVVYPTEGGSGLHMRPAVPSLGLQWGQAALTDADPVKFKAWVEVQLAPLEAAGIHLTAFELGNEINGPFFNGDFVPAEASGRVLGLPDLDNASDPEGRTIAASYRAYLRVAAAMKDVRDHSKLNQKTPIISAGLADGGLPGKRAGQKLDGVSIPATLRFLRDNGLDDLADGYGVHVYPGGQAKQPVASFARLLQADAFAECTARKPCWLTEWGFDNSDKSCPPDERQRGQLIETMRGALKTFAQQGRLAASIYYSWGRPGELGSSIERCGALTSAGKLALSPM
ncbi:MAG: hypothetical protein JOZ74_13065 [Bradyrhizobium sp.]|nr:hypothetical protein [Bradyrhizobium sp.]